MKNPTTLIVAVFLTVSQISFAQQNEKKREVLFDIGLTSQTLLDKHISSLSWSGMGLEQQFLIKNLSKRHSY